MVFALLRSSSKFNRFYHSSCKLRSSTNGIANDHKKWGEQEFWDTYYKGKEETNSDDANDSSPTSTSSFDWFTSTPQLISSVAQTATKLAKQKKYSHPRVLHLGAGTSSLCEALHSRLPKDATLIHTDYSPLAINNLERRLKDILNVRHKVIQWDILLPPPSIIINTDYNTEEKYDVIIDKGFLDVFIHSQNNKSLRKALSQISSLLKNDGVYLQITNDDIASRGEIFDRYGGGWENWDLGRVRGTEIVGEGEEGEGGGFVVNVIEVRKS